MNNELRPYEEYKSIDLSWLSEIPSNWTIQRGKQLFKIIDERTSTGDEELLSVSANYGVVKRKNTNVTMFMAASYVGYKLCWEKDLVVNSLWAWQQGLGFSKYHGIISTAYSVYRLRSEKENYKYYDYLLRSSSYLWELRIRSKGIWRSRYQLHDSSFMDMPFLIPPRPEQDRIVKFLDHKLAKINKFIKAKKKLIAVLKEQKQAIINQAVTKGLNSNVTMKPSGVEWLGDVPEHWKISRCKYLFREMDLRSKTGTETHLSMSQKYGLISDDRLEERRLLSESYVGGKICAENDLVLNRLKAHLGVFALAPQTGVISPDYTVLRPNSKILPRYAEAVLKSSKCRKELRVRVRGIVEGFWRLYTDDFNTIALPLPDYDEQVRIMEFIAVSSTKIDNAIERIEGEIELVSEFKNSIISDVVTGKVDVRHIAIDESEEMDIDESGIDEELTDEEAFDSEECNE